MGWEERKGKLYYYRKERDEATGRVRSVYCGTGERAERAAREDEARRRGGVVASVKVVGNLRPIGLKPSTESQARELAPPVAQPEVPSNSPLAADWLARLRRRGCAPSTADTP